MNTEMTWMDMLPSLKLSGKLTMGLVKGAIYLGKKALSSSQNSACIDDTVPAALQSPEPCGVVFGKQGESYITKPEDMDGHVLVVGGVGSGKSACVAIPTLRTWRERVFAIDIKGELYEKTRQYRPNINPTI